MFHVIYQITDIKKTEKGKKDPPVIESNYCDEEILYIYCMFLRVYFGEKWLWALWLLSKTTEGNFGGVSKVQSESKQPQNFYPKAPHLVPATLWWYFFLCGSTAMIDE